MTNGVKFWLGFVLGVLTGWAIVASGIYVGATWGLKKAPVKVLYVQASDQQCASWWFEKKLKPHEFKARVCSGVAQ